jgi:AraC-like DNA-binding protein
VDLISEAVATVAVGRADGRRIAESGPSGLRLPALPVLGFHVLLAGAGWLITADGPPVALREGDVVFVAAGAEHGIARVPCRLAELPPAELAEVPPPPAPVDFEFLCGTYPLPQGRRPAVLRHLPEVVACTPDYERHPQLRAVVELLRADYTNPQAGSDAARGALIDLIIVHILRLLQDRWPLTGDPGIAAALRDMHARPAQPWTVQQLSAVAGMSRSVFTRRFREVTGAAPIAYLTDRRLATGAQLLRETSAPLTTVARRAGYATPFAFTTAFRRKFGVPPGRYRESVRARVSD